MSHIRPIAPIGPANQTAPTTTMASVQTQATRGQAQITGAASNYSVHEKLQKEQNAKQRLAQRMLGTGDPVIGTLEALEALPDMKGGHNEDDDPSAAGRGLSRRRSKKRKVFAPRF